MTPSILSHFPLFCIEGTIQISDPPMGARNQRPINVPAGHLLGGGVSRRRTRRSYPFWDMRKCSRLWIQCFWTWNSISAPPCNKGCKTKFFFNCFTFSLICIYIHLSVLFGMQDPYWFLFATFGDPGAYCYCYCAYYLQMQGIRCRGLLVLNEATATGRVLIWAFWFQFWFQV